MNLVFAGECGTAPEITDLFQDVYNLPVNSVTALGQRSDLLGN
jgi:hypothetical protein